VRKAGLIMVKNILIISTLLLAACGGSPLAPEPMPPIQTNATLAVLVMGHLSERPLQGVTVRLEPIEKGATSEGLQKITDASGRVSWPVVAGERYSVSVRGQLAITASLLQGDAQWLVSLPE